MLKLSLLLIVAFLGSNKAQQNEHIYEISVDITENQFIDYIKDKFKDNSYKLSLVDLINLFDLQDLKWEQFQDIFLQKPYTKTEVFKFVDYILNDGTFHTVLSKITANLNVENSQFIANLSIFNVDQTKYVMAVVNKPGTEYDVIKSGDYSQEKWKDFIESLQVENQAIYANCLKLFVDVANLRNSQKNQIIFQEFKPPYNTLLHNVSFTLQKVQNMPQFNEDLQWKDSIKQDKFAAVLVDNLGLIINHKIPEIYHNFSQYLDIKVQNSFGTLFAQLERFQQTKNYALFPVTGRNGLQFGFKNESLENCSYFSINSGQILQHPVYNTSIEEFTIYGDVLEENLEENFVIGGPLICDGKLYGLAWDRNESTVSFDNVLGDAPPRPVIVDGGADLIASFVLILVSILCINII